METYRISVEAIFMWCNPVIDAIHNSPPENPGQGNRFLVATPSVFNWSGHTGEIATWNGDKWVFEKPDVGWLVYDKYENRVKLFNGQSWNILVQTGQIFQRKPVASKAWVGSGITNVTNTSVKEATYNGELGCVDIEA